jgi:hypothetical protein
MRRAPERFESGCPEMRAPELVLQVILLDLIHRCRDTRRSRLQRRGRRLNSSGPEPFTEPFAEPLHYRGEAWEALQPRAATAWI